VTNQLEGFVGRHGLGILLRFYVYFTKFISGSILWESSPVQQSTVDAFCNWRCSPWRCKASSSEQDPYNNIIYSRSL